MGKLPSILQYGGNGRHPIGKHLGGIATRIKRHINDKTKANIVNTPQMSKSKHVLDLGSPKSKALERAKGKSRNIASTGLNTKTGRYTPEAMKHMTSKSRKGYSEK